jgi:hypothetical protein
MSKWGSARGTPTTPFGDVDDTESVSSKAPSRSALVTPNHFQNFRFTAAKMALDATAKQVAWYDIEVTTIDCVWTVVKRFSDCSSLFSSINKLKLGSFSLVTRMPFPSFPSKFHLGKQSSQFIERRRSQLEVFFQQLLLYLQRLSVAAVGEQVAPPYMKVLKAGFTMLVDFSRRNSSTGVESAERGTTAGAAVEDPLIMQSRRDLFGCSNLLASSNQPRVRLIHLAKRFSIAIFLPGVLLKNMYVDTTDLGDRVVTIGGCWNEAIFTVDDVRDDLGSPKSGFGGQGSFGQPQKNAMSGAEGSDGPAPGPAVGFDSFPTGSFEMLHEVPLPYERCHWSSEYEAGVLFLHWDAPP